MTKKKYDLLDKEKTLNDFSERVQYIMNKKGIKRYQLADMVCMDRSTMSKYLNCKRTPNIHVIKKIAYALGCSISDLIE